MKRTIVVGSAMAVLAAATPGLAGEAPGSPMVLTPPLVTPARNPPPSLMSTTPVADAPPPGLKRRAVATPAPRPVAPPSLSPTRLRATLPASEGPAPVEARPLPPPTATVSPAPLPPAVAETAPPVAPLAPAPTEAFPASTVAEASPATAQSGVPMPRERPGGHRPVRVIAGVPAGPMPPMPEPATTGAPAAAVAAAADEPVDDPPFFTGSVGAGATVADNAAAPAGDGAMPVVPVGQPYQMVRTLQLLQDDMAQGSTEALVAQRKLRDRINRQFLAADPAVWQEPRNASAAVIFVLSGGAPDILKRLIALRPPPAVDEKLVGGVLAYVEGKEHEANVLLGGIDVYTLPPSMAGQVALAQATLAVRSDPKKAMKLLDTARLLAPGTLVEEAALRREIFVADQHKAQDKLESLARQYLDRFRHSVYAGNFRNRFTASISHLDFGDDPDQFHRLDEMLAEAEPDGRRQLYLTAALAALIKGKTKTAAYAADQAGALAEDDTPDQARARLYRAGALAVDAKSFDVALADIKAVKPELLPAADQALYERVKQTVENIRTATDLPTKAAWVRVAQLDKDANMPAPLPVMKRAADAIAAADELLKADQQ